MHEYYEIKSEISPLLISNGFLEEVENLSPDFYGSMNCIFTRGAKRVYIGWDGKGGFGVVKIWNDGDWFKIEPLLVEASEDVFKDNLQRIKSQIIPYVQ